MYRLKLGGNTIFERRNKLLMFAIRSRTRFAAHTVKMEHSLMMYTICELHAVVRFVSVLGETVMNINRILCVTYAKDGLSYDSTICQRWG